MENLNIEKFNPTKSEIIKVVKEASLLVIEGVKDTVGYKKVHEARMELKNMRVKIQKTGKELRSEAIAFQKAVIEKEKEFVSMIEPVESELQAKQNAIDGEKEKAKRIELLPERQFKMKAVELVVEDEVLLSMDNDEFDGFYNQKNAEYLAEKERKIKDEQEKIEVEKKKIEEDKRIEQAKKEAEKFAQEKAIRDAKLAKIQAEKDKQEAVEMERNRAEQEKRQLIEEQKRKDQERIDEQNRAKLEVESKLEKEKIEQERVESQKKYQNFLKKNGYTETDKNNFIVQRNGKQVVLFKKIAEINL